jgi:hypothetical protein
MTELIFAVVLVGPRVVYDLRVMVEDRQLRITPPGQPLGAEVEVKLREALDACPDLAFAHLVDVEIPEHGEAPDMVLFVWLVPAAMKSMRAALNLVSEAVATALPPDRYLDVVILNSAPEVLPDVERAGCLFVEPHADERQRALAAASIRAQG